MFCYRIRNRLIPYIEGGLDRRNMGAIARHVARCQRCASELLLVRAAGNAFRDAKSPAKEPADNLWERIEAKLEAAVRPAPAWYIRSLQVAGTAAAAAVILLAVVNVSKIGDMLDRSRPVVSTPRPPIVSLEHGTLPSSGKPTHMGATGPSSGIPSKSPGGHRIPAATPGINIEKPEHTVHLGVAVEPPPGASAVSEGSDEKSAHMAAPPVSTEVVSAVPGTVSDGTFDWSGEGAGSRESAAGVGAVATPGPSGPSGPAGPAGRDSRIAEEKEDSSFNEESGAVFFGDRTEIASKPSTLGYSFRSITEDSTGVDAVGAFTLKLVDTDTTETSVDLLNDADTEARYMALFSYP